MKSVRERMDMSSTDREVGRYRAAADICGTTPETVKRAVLAERRAEDAGGQEAVEHNCDSARDIVVKGVEATWSRIPANRLMPVVVAAGYGLGAQPAASCGQREGTLAPGKPPAAAPSHWVPVDIDVDPPYPWAQLDHVAAAATVRPPRAAAPGVDRRRSGRVRVGASGSTW